MFRRIFLVVLLAGAGVSPALAVTVSGLYSAEVPVAGSSPGQLNAGYQEGLRRVIVRVSGSDDVLRREGVSDLVGRAESLLQSYQFLRGDDSNPYNRLRMTFGAVGVNQALAAIDAPVWGANRPLTLAWIAVEAGGARQLLVAPEEGRAEGDAARQWREAFQRAAINRGLPLNLPPRRFNGDRELMSEIWGQFMGQLRTASSELDHDLLSAVRVTYSGGQWRAGWVFEGVGFEESETGVRAGSIDDLAAAVVGRWANMLASTYAVAAGEVGELPQVDIVIDQLDSLEDYAAAQRALGDLTPVQSVGAVRVTSSRATLRVAFSGELDQLKGYIALDARFVPQSSADLPPAPAPAAVPAPEAAAGSSSDPASESPENAGEPSGTQGAEEPALQYQPLMVEGKEAAQAFGSLYQVLHYRWQSAPAARATRGN